MQDMVKEPKIIREDVFGGPGSKAYAKIGYLDPVEFYKLLWEEYGYKFIEYTSNDTGSKKRG